VNGLPGCKPRSINRDLLQSSIYLIHPILNFRGRKQIKEIVHVACNDNIVVCQGDGGDHDIRVAIVRAHLLPERFYSGFQLRATFTAALDE
jgi:hypothetical protein